MEDAVDLLSKSPRNITNAAADLEAARSDCFPRIRLAASDEVGAAFVLGPFANGGTAQLSKE